MFPEGPSVQSFLPNCGILLQSQRIPGLGLLPVSSPHLPQRIQAFSTGCPCTDGAAASNGGQRAWTQTQETLSGNKPFFLLSELPEGFCHSHKKRTQAFL